ncbi:hypothetical protein ACIBKY_43915 [Nonomuraea sp. NPDC050394]|uniref:hypothetical protein n=1 Tax=Nonomuraea sp. NPDC050394 TaxID=3364363 RepID=UPI0037A978AD
MNGWAWRLEWLRLCRTHRFLAAAALFITFGMSGPFMALYSGAIIARAGASLSVPPVAVTPAAGVASFVDNSIGLGLLLVIVIAAATLAIDHRPAVSIYYRSRARSAAALIIPRYVVVTLAMIAAYSVGAWITWYETAVLIAMPSAAAMVLGNLLVALYLAFAVAVVALLSALLRGMLLIAGVAAMALLALPVAGLVPGLGAWMPSRLLTAQHTLLGTAGLTDFTPAAAVAAIATTICLTLATRYAYRREI